MNKSIYKIGIAVFFSLLSFSYSQTKDSHYDSNISLRSLFSYEQDRVLYFEGPFDSERTWYFTLKNEICNGVEYSVNIITDDLSGEQKFSDLISSHLLVINDDEILLDNTILLKNFLEVGTQWDTIWNGMDFQPKANAHIKIVSIENDIITTKIVIDNLSDYVGETFTAYFYFQKNVGIIGYKHNMNYSQESLFFMVLMCEALKPENKDNWYFPWYQRSDMKQLKYYDYTFDLIIQ